MSSSEDKNFSYKLVLCSLFLILFIDGLGISIVLPLFEEMFLSKHSGILPDHYTPFLRNFFYGFSLISFSVGMFFGSPILGELSDKFGRKKILIFSLLGTVFGYGISGLGVFFKMPELFILGRLLDGLTAGSVPIAQAAIADVSTQENKAGNLGLILFAVTAGYVMGPLLSDFSARSFSMGLTTPFYGTAILSLMSLIFLFPMKETSQINISQRVNWLKSLNFFEMVEKTKSARSTFLVLLFFQLAWTMYFQYLPYCMLAKKLSHFSANLFAVIGLGMCISFCFLTGFLQNKIKYSKGIVISIGIIIFSLLTQLVAQDIRLIFLFSFTAALAYGVGYSFLLAKILQEVPDGLQGLVMGISASASALSATTTASLGFIIVEIEYDLPFLFSIFCLGIAFVITCSLSRPKISKASKNASTLIR